MLLVKTFSNFCRVSLFPTAILFLLSAQNVFAAATGMPWESPLDQLLNSLTGPVARVGGAVSIVGLGFGLAYSEGGGIMRKALMIVMGLTIVFNAVSWGLGFFGYGGGLAI
jgi:type IV secretion system protein VirB2